MTNAVRAPLALAAVLALAACSAGSTAGTTAGSAWTITPGPTPASEGSAQPQLTATNGRALLSWVERKGPSASLRFSDRTADGWSEPRTASSGDNWFVNWADVPSVVRLPDNSLAAHWLQKSGAGTYAYDVRLAFSKDDGRTWSDAVTPHHDGTQTEHGFASLYPAGAGLGIVWLDGRAMQPGHHEGTSGAMSVRAAVFDAAGQQASEVAVDERVCECCPTAVAMTSAGPIVAFRNRSDEEVRDIYVSRLVDGQWTTPAGVHADNWKIPACPVNGPALSARDRLVAIAWYTMVEGKGRAFVAFSQDAGATFGAPIRLDDAATLGRVDVELLDDGAVAATWIELAGEQSEFRVRRIPPTGERGPSQAVATLSSGRSSGYPRMTRAGEEILFAWTEAGTAPQVRTASIRLR